MFNDKKTLVVFGDSNVWGAEMLFSPHKQHEFKNVVYDPSDLASWPHHIRYSFPGVLAERHNMKILNLAIPGSSNDTIFRRVNQFLQGNYPVDLDECFVMIFWTTVERREFVDSQVSRPNIGYRHYTNYSPAWGDRNPTPFRKFHKLYVKTIFPEEYDIQKTFNYMYSLNGLLSHHGVDFVQGYSLFKDELGILVQACDMLNFISDDCIDSVHAIAADFARQHFKTKTKPPTPNPYQFEGSHPTELGHLEIANRYEQLLKQRQAT